MKKNDESTIRKFLLDSIKNKISQNNSLSHDLSDDFNFLTSGIIDSFEFFEMVADFEDKFNIQMDFSDVDPREFTTIKGFVKLAASMI